MSINTGIDRELDSPVEISELMQLAFLHRWQFRLPADGQKSRHI
jgi:hypothetical protein